jgi:hypothetical protein
MNARGVWKAVVGGYTLPSNRGAVEDGRSGTVDHGDNTRSAQGDARHAGVGYFMRPAIHTPGQHVSDWS